VGDLLPGSGSTPDRQTKPQRGKLPMLHMVQAWLSVQQVG